MNRLQYSKHRKAKGLRGGSHVAVGDAIKSGRITLEPDGSIDPVKADAEWARTTQERSRVTVTSAPNREPARQAQDQDMPARAYSTSRAIREGFLAQITKMNYDLMAGKLISRDEVAAERLNRNRMIRDGVLNIADRVAATIAADVAGEMSAAGLPFDLSDLTHKVHETMTAELHNALNGLADDLASS